VFGQRPLPDLDMPLGQKPPASLTVVMPLAAIVFSVSSIAS
jgi:hypothetical protein